MKQQAKRFHDLDLARAIPILAMPLVHCYEEFIQWDALSESLMERGRFWLYLCVLGPSIFMISLGMNLIFSRHTSPKELAKRGVITLLLGLLLNLLRFTIPACISQLFGYEDGVIEGAIYLFVPDILTFAGLAFLLFALFKKWKLSSFTILMISFLCLAINTMIPHIETDHGVVEEVLGAFFYVDEDTPFPLLSWLVFPAIGYCAGEILVRFENKEKMDQFYRKVFVASAVILISISACLYSYGLNPLLIASSPANESITDLFNVILMIGVAGVWYAAIHFLYDAIHSEKVKAAAEELSKSILTFFIVQWVLIGWMEYITCGWIGITTISGVQLVVISIIMFIATLVVTRLIRMRKRG